MEWPTHVPIVGGGGVTFRVEVLVLIVILGFMFWVLRIRV